MKRGLVARAAHHPRDRRRQRARARPGGIGGVEHHHVRPPAERRHRRGEAADEADVRRALEQVAPRVVARHAPAAPPPPPAPRSRRSPRPSPSAPPKAWRGGREIGPPELVARSSQAPRASRSSMPAPYVPGAEPKMRAGRSPPHAAASGFSVLRSRRAPPPPPTAASISAICVGEHVAEEPRDAPGHVDPRPPQQRRRQHLDAASPGPSPRPSAAGSPSAPALARSPRRRSGGSRCPRGRAPALRGQSPCSCR